MRKYTYFHYSLLKRGKGQHCLVPKTKSCVAYTRLLFITVQVGKHRLFSAELPHRSTLMHPSLQQMALRTALIIVFLWNSVPGGEGISCHALHD